MPLVNSDQRSDAAEWVDGHLPINLHEGIVHFQESINESKFDVWPRQKSENKGTLLH